MPMSITIKPTSLSCYLFLLFLVIGPSVSAQPIDTPWWKERPLRIYHPNMRELEAEDLDVRQFVEDCRDLHAEAIVFSVGGPYAFYNTEVPFHKKSPNMGDRDLLEEVIREAHKVNIRVIARLDFSVANLGVFEQHPEWFYLDPQGNPDEKRSSTEEKFLRTNLLEGYRNEDFAFPVLKEICSGYEVDGIHLNAPGFRATQFSSETMKKFGIPEDPEEQKLWREERLAKQMMEYREIILSHIPEALFMAEINSPENPGWGESRSFNHELLAGSYTNLLSTAGEPSEVDLYRLRWWSALAADWSHASKSKESGLPLINLKVGHQMGKLSLKPISDYKLNCYQAFAHNAGIKAPSYGLMRNMPDPRTASMIAEPFKFIERCEPLLTGAEKIAPVALVWPGMEAEGIKPASFRIEMLGIYRALVSEHALFEIILAHRLQNDLSDKHHTVIVPSVSLLNPGNTEALQTFVESGGHLILFDALPDKPWPVAWSKFLGVEQTGKPYACAYAVSGENSNSGLPASIMLSLDLRQVNQPVDAKVWYYNSLSPGGGNWVPEVFPLLEKDQKPVLFSIGRGKGKVSYFAGAFGTMMWGNDLPDYSDILEQLIIEQSNGKKILETDAPPTVNITAYRTGSKTVIHLVNGTGKIPLDNPVPVGPIQIKLIETSSSRGQWFAPGMETKKLDISIHQGTLKVSIEKLYDYGIVVLE